MPGAQNAYPLTKSYRIGSGEAAAWGPMVGGKKNRTGAVCKPSCTQGISRALDANDGQMAGGIHS